MSVAKRQGIVSGYVTYNKKIYMEIFDNKYHYLYGEESEFDIDAGVWVQYFVTEAPRDHPKNCKYFAEEVQEVKPENSTAPTSDEFRDRAIDVNDFNRVDYFQYDTITSVLSHKTSVARAPNGEFASEYYGFVTMNRDEMRRLNEHYIDEVNVTTALIPSGQYTGGAFWRVTQFMHEGKPYSLNGFLSITGRVLRGPGGVVRNRREVTIPRDALRPIGYNPQAAAPPRQNPPAFGHLRNSADNYRAQEAIVSQMNNVRIRETSPPSSPRSARESRDQQEHQLRLCNMRNDPRGLGVLNGLRGFGFGNQNQNAFNSNDTSANCSIYYDTEEGPSAPRAQRPPTQPARSSLGGFGAPNAGRGFGTTSGGFGSSGRDTRRPPQVENTRRAEPARVYSMVEEKPKKKVDSDDEWEMEKKEAVDERRDFDRYRPMKPSGLARFGNQKF